MFIFDKSAQNTHCRRPCACVFVCCAGVGVCFLRHTCHTPRRKIKVAETARFRRFHFFVPPPNLLPACSSVTGCEPDPTAAGRQPPYQRRRGRWPGLFGTPPHQPARIALAMTSACCPSLRRTRRPGLSVWAPEAILDRPCA